MLTSHVIGKGVQNLVENLTYQFNPKVPINWKTWTKIQALSTSLKDNCFLQFTFTSLAKFSIFNVKFLGRKVVFYLYLRSAIRFLFIRYFKTPNSWIIVVRRRKCRKETKMAYFKTHVPYVSQQYSLEIYALSCLLFCKLLQSAWTAFSVWHLLG